MSKFGQFAASSQYYLYGKKHFTRTGWEKHKKEYDRPDLLTQDLDLSEKVFMVTGANSGIGKEVARYLAGRKGTVYMVCRNRARAEAAVSEIIGATGNSRVHLLEADVGLASDVRRCMQEFAAHSGREIPRLDAVVCNAGALLSEKTMTSEGVEATFASHLLFGTYLLGRLAMPSLQATPGSRFIAMSSGGVYNFAFPSWEVATSTQIPAWGAPQDLYDGQMALSYANRGKVLLCERWADEFPSVKVVSCHPGWTDTPAIEAAYGDTKKNLEPMRTPWEGAEGIAWLCVAPSKKLVSGSFYLDRKPQVKHMAGPFFTEGTHTKNSPVEVHNMMKRLDDWSSGVRPDFVASVALGQCCQIEVIPADRPLRAFEDQPMQLPRFMGRWYIVADIPSPGGRSTVNHTEDYFYDVNSQTVMIDFSYSDLALTRTSHLFQEAMVVNKACSEWQIKPKGSYSESGHIPYIITYWACDYSSAIVGVPDRSYIAIMTRDANPDNETMELLMKRAEAMGYDLSTISTAVQDRQHGESVGGPESPERSSDESDGGLEVSSHPSTQRSNQIALGVPQHDMAANEVSKYGLQSCLLVLFFCFIGALLCGGLSFALASQRMGLYIGCGAALGLILGITVEVVRRRCKGCCRARPVMDGSQSAKRPLVDLEDASTTASSFGASISASLASSARG